MKYAPCAVALFCLFLPSIAACQKAGADNVWRNPQNSVHVRIHPCATGRCGTVVWANDKAKKDSAKGGTAQLIGLELFREFRKESANRWKGKVFVPDMNRVFSGTITIESPTAAVARGCLMGKIGCKSQTWTRVAGGQR